MGGHTCKFVTTQPCRVLSLHNHAERVLPSAAARGHLGHHQRACASCSVWEQWCRPPKPVPYRRLRTPSPLSVRSSSAPMAFANTALPSASISTLPSGHRDGRSGGDRLSGWHTARRAAQRRHLVALARAHSSGVMEARATPPCQPGHPHQAAAAHHRHSQREKRRTPAPTLLPQASITNASLTDTQAMVSTPLPRSSSAWPGKKGGTRLQWAAAPEREGRQQRRAGFQTVPRPACLPASCTARPRTFSMKPGRCLREQVGVKAPGTANSTTCAAAPQAGSSRQGVPYCSSTTAWQKKGAGGARCPFLQWPESSTCAGVVPAKCSPFCPWSGCPPSPPACCPPHQSS